MKIYIITDTHFGHDKMIELCGRPEGFEEIVFKNLKLIPEGAILIHLGDFCIGDDAEWHERFFEATRHVKRKILVRGNHDHKSDSWYLEHGWDFVCREFANDYYKKDILFTHAPSSLAKEYTFNIHGHLHNTGHHEVGTNGNEILLAIENTDYKAVNLEKLIAL